MLKTESELDRGRNVAEKNPGAIMLMASGIVRTEPRKNSRNSQKLFVSFGRSFIAGALVRGSKSWEIQ
ncbi:MAG: hypothetical protein OXF86_06470 [Caldilineaceae bacterium]|nr:hypothetical protein [Caldilineaceae bacterium]